MSKRVDSRRAFLGRSAAAFGTSWVPYFLSRNRVLADETKSKNDRFTVGWVGAGGQGTGNMKAAASWIDVVAIADVDQTRLNAANETICDGKADIYSDYRKIIDRRDIDIVHIATPDHWHTKPLIEAMLAGKDVYCEKPLTLTIDEGKLIRKIQQQTGRIVQVGTQQRSTFELFVKAMAIVNEGRLGKIQQITVSIGSCPTSGSIPVVAPPAELDWDRWLGPVPKTDYRCIEVEPTETDKKLGVAHPVQSNCHQKFRWWYEYSGGKLTDWGAHHVDIAIWALHLNGQTVGPRSIAGSAKHPVEFQDGMPTRNDCYNTATEFEFAVDFPGDTKLLIVHDATASHGFDNGVMIEGTQGKIFVNRGKLRGAPVDALQDSPLPDNALQRVYKNSPMEDNEKRAHWANFLHCVRTRREPISDVHSHMKMLNVCHLAAISGRLGRKIHWDAANEVIVGDTQANAMLARPYRPGYEIEM